MPRNPAHFDETLRDSGLRVQKAAYRSPNTVAFVERFNQTLRQELLDHFIVFGEPRPYRLRFYNDIAVSQQRR